MNALLQELVFETCEHIDLKPGTSNIPDEFLEKFAELIVKECLECCERAVSAPITIHNVLNGGYICQYAIKEHFGVEE